MNEHASPTCDLAITIGNNLRRWRKDQSITQNELSRKVGLSQGYFSKLELGKKTPNLRTLQRFATVTGVPIRDLISDQSQPTDQGAACLQG